MFFILVHLSLVPIWDEGKMIVWKGTLSLPMNCTKSTSSGFCHHAYKTNNDFDMTRTEFESSTWAAKHSTISAFCIIINSLNIIANLVSNCVGEHHLLTIGFSATCFCNNCQQSGAVFWSDILVFKGSDLYIQQFQVRVKHKAYRLRAKNSMKISPGSPLILATWICYMTDTGTIMCTCELSDIQVSTELNAKTPKS